MNIKWVLLPLLIAFAGGCAAMPVREDTIFTPSEKRILEKSTEALDYGYGYDHDVGLDYIHSYAFSETNMPAREKALAAALRDFETGEILGFYSKLYRLGIMMQYRLKEYEKGKTWKQYTYLKNYLLPPVETFTGHIRKQLLARDPSLERRLPEVHARAEKAVADYFYELEMEVLRDQWRI
jgi:hypothetical protein